MNKRWQVYKVEDEKVDEIRKSRGWVNKNNSKRGQT